MATLTVGQDGTEQFGTIASAVAAANPDDTIDVNAGTYNDDFLTIEQDLTLQAIGGPVVMTEDTSPDDGKAMITEGQPGVNVTINGFDISGVSVGDSTAPRSATRAATSRSIRTTSTTTRKASWAPQIPMGRLPSTIASSRTTATARASRIISTSTSSPRSRSKILISTMRTSATTSRAALTRRSFKIIVFRTITAAAPHTRSISPMPATRIFPGT
jgi:hypothetical protein